MARSEGHFLKLLGFQSQTNQRISPSASCRCRGCQDSRRLEIGYMPLVVSRTCGRLVYHQSQWFFIFPHIFVWGSCFWLCTPVRSSCLLLPPPASTFSRSRTTYSHTNHTQLSHTQEELTHNTTYSHTTLSHTTHSHTTHSHATYSHTPLTHNSLIRNLFTHNSLTQNSLTHNSLTHNFLTHTTRSHTAYPHTTRSQTTYWQV